MNSPITFGTLDRLLNRLGFVETLVPSSHVTYEHRSSETIILLRPHKPEERVEQRTWAAVRRILDKNGLMGRDESDKLETIEFVREGMLDVQGGRTISLEDFKTEGAKKLRRSK